MKQERRAEQEVRSRSDIKLIGFQLQWYVVHKNIFLGTVPRPQHTWL